MVQRGFLNALPLPSPPLLPPPSPPPPPLLPPRPRPLPLPLPLSAALVLPASPPRPPSCCLRLRRRKTPASVVLLPSKLANLWSCPSMVQQHGVMGHVRSWSWSCEKQVFFRSSPKPSCQAKSWEIVQGNKGALLQSSLIPASIRMIGCHKLMIAQAWLPHWTIFARTVS